MRDVGAVAANMHAGVETDPVPPAAHDDAITRGIGIVGTIVTGITPTVVAAIVGIAPLAQRARRIGFLCARRGARGRGRRRSSLSDFPDWELTSTGATDAIVPFNRTCSNMKRLLC
jgi:hypothetical protein